MTPTCAICARLFRSAREGQKFCSLTCMHAGQRREETRTCTVCGAAFTCQRSAKKRACSVACRGLAQRKQREAPAVPEADLAAALKAADRETYFFIRRWARSLWPEREELGQTCRLAVLVASTHYEADRGATFRTYAAHTVRNALSKAWSRHREPPVSLEAYLEADGDVEGEVADPAEVAATRDLLRRAFALLPGWARVAAVRRFVRGESWSELAPPGMTGAQVRARWERAVAGSGVRERLAEAR